VKKLRIGLALPLVLLSSLSWISSAQAQVQGGDWSPLYRLSSDAGIASEGYCLADQYGYVDCFWTETLFEDGRTIIQFARFDGETWSTPNEIYVTAPFVGIKNVSPVVDQNGILHIAWAEGLNGPAYYTRAPVNVAISARSWAPPVRISVPAGNLRLQVDPQGVFHILYVKPMNGTGVFYIRSEDQGTSWSDPKWLDPDILPNHIPDSLNFEVDSAGGLHAAWFYSGLDLVTQADWVRYTHSLDGGTTWSSPFLIDYYVEEGDHDVSFAQPVLAIQDQTVHIIWAAGELPYRHYRYSTDRGSTWSEPRRLFGELHGQAFDGMTVDRAGRLHYFAQIRYPKAIYHAYMDQTRWSVPEVVYFIANEGEEKTVEDAGDKIGAHETHPIVRAGNQLVLTFTDSPSDPHRRLFAIHRMLGDIPPLETMPTPTPPATATPFPSPTPWQPTAMPTATATARFSDAASTQPLAPLPGWDFALQVAMVPTLLLLAGIVVVRWLYKFKA
jgi:hypothetical protein